MPSDVGYFELGNLFGESFKPKVKAASVEAETKGKLAREKMKQINRRKLLDTLGNLAIIGAEGKRGFDKSSERIAFAKDKGFGLKDGDINDVGFFDKLFGSQTFTKDGRDVSGAEIDIFRKFGDLLDVNNIFGTGE